MIRVDFNKSTKIFKNPKKIISTNKIELVANKLKEVEDEVEKGRYLAGYLSYEASYAFIKTGDKKLTKMPLLYFGVFDSYEEEDSYKTKDKEEKIVWRNDTSFDEYSKNIQKIEEELKSGNSYQVNYATRLKGKFTKDAYGYYLKKMQGAQYCAYLDIEDFNIISLSPELFFKLENGKLTAKPMKGTAKRGVGFEDDKRQKRVLKSLKNRTENLMIVDLLRNDLGVISKPGSVKVDNLFEPEKYPTLWQLTSTISSTLKQDTSIVEIFKALFPCGSITGAPKRSTMGIISKMEKSPREIYCGAIGYISPQRDAIFSVPIRTIMIEKQTKEATYGVGGGITLDSTTKDEYDEIINKAAILNDEILEPKELLESFLLENGEYFLYDLHIKRLISSAKYFDFKIDKKLIKKALQKEIKDNKKYKVRLTLNKDGEFFIEKEEIGEFRLESISTSFVNSKNLFLYHKTTTRDFFPKLQKNCEALLINEKEEITEFVNANALFFIDGEWLTPPIKCGLLAGVMREYLLKNKEIKEAIIKKEDIKKATKIGYINSVRGFVDVTKLIKIQPLCSIKV